SYTSGFIAAHRNLTAASNWKSPSEDLEIRLLFSDGKRTIESRARDWDVTIIYRDPDANVKLERDIGSLSKNPLHTHFDGHLFTEAALYAENHRGEKLASQTRSGTPKKH